MPLTTTTEIPGPVNVDMQMILLRNAKAVAPYFAGSTAAEIREHEGTFTARWRRIENLTPSTTPLTELTGSVAFPTRTAVQPSRTDLDATVQKYGQFIFLNEEVDLINFNSQAAKLLEVIGIVAGRSVNRLQRDVLEDNLTGIFAATATTATGINSGSTASGEIHLSELAVAVNAINRNDGEKFLSQTLGAREIGTSPIRNSYIGINHVDTTEDVRLLTGFQSVETYAGQTQTLQAEYGAAGGIRFVESSESTIDTGLGHVGTGSATAHGRAATSNRADVYNTVVIGRDCHGSLGLGFQHVKEIYKAGDRLPGVQIISTAKGSAGSADPLREISTVGYKTWHAGRILNTNWGRVIRHAVTRLESNE